MLQGGRPWWVLGAEVHQTLEMVSILCTLARIQVDPYKVDNDDGFCLREQLWADGMNLGVNQDAGTKLRKVCRKAK